MNDLKRFRNQYNFSQSFFAICLNTTKSQLSMAELGLRRLPNDAAARLSWLERHMLPAAQQQFSSTLPGTHARFQNNEETAMINFLVEEIIEYKHELSQLEKTLNASLQRREKARATLYLMMSMIQELNDGSDLAPAPQWVHKARVEAETEIVNIPASKILSLEIKITGVDAQLQAAEKKLDALKSSLEASVEPEAALAPTGGEAINPAPEASLPRDHRMPAPALHKSELPFPVENHLLVTMKDVPPGRTPLVWKIGHGEMVNQRNTYNGSSMNTLNLKELSGRQLDKSEIQFSMQELMTDLVSLKGSEAGFSVH